MISNREPMSNYPKIVGITGKKRHGKDTLGNYLVEHYGYIRVAFADAIKDMLRCSFGFSEEQLNGSEKENADPFWKVSPREVLQFVGTELFRDQMSQLIPNVGSDFWVWIVRKKILDILEKNPEAKFVISDVRFPNELEFIQNIGKELKGVTTIRVDRPTFNDSTIGIQHLSETQIENLKVEHVILNDSSIEHLYESLDSIFFLYSIQCFQCFQQKR